MTLMLGVGDFGATNAAGEVVKTMALGSCVAVVMLHPKTRSVGMVHVALPDSSINKDRARERPGYFADTGLPALMREMIRLGCNRQGRDLIIKMAGGARVMDPQNTFNIGKRNILAIKKLLWQQGLGAVAEDVGGKISRTVAVEVDTGRMILSSAGRPNWEL